MDSSTPFQPWSSDDNSKNVKSERELVDDAKLHRENVNHPKHRQTASYNKESVVDPSVVPGPSSATDTDVHPLGGKESKMDSSKIASMQQIVENTLRYLIFMVYRIDVFYMTISLLYALPQFFFYKIYRHDQNNFSYFFK